MVAAASERWRRAVIPDVIRESVRRLFRLRERQSERDEFCNEVAEQVWEPVRDQVRRQIRNSGRMYRVFEERGGEEAVTEAGVTEIVTRIRHWLDQELEDWMAEIHDTVDETRWLGERHGAPGVIDILLLADALGLAAYAWNAEVGASPFRRLDMVAGMPTGLLVLSELYAQSMPVMVGA